MFPSIPLVFFNPQHKIPLKNLPKLLSLDPLGQGFTHSVLLMNIFSLLSSASSASQVDIPHLHSLHNAQPSDHCSPSPCGLSGIS